jgi:hypothetical protein
MLTIAWNLNGFRLIDAMPKGQKQSARYHINNITIPICQQLIPAGKHILINHPITPGATLPKSSSALCRKEKSDLTRIPHIPQTQHHLTSSFSAT